MQVASAQANSKKLKATDYPVGAQIAARKNARRFSVIHRSFARLQSRQRRVLTANS